MKKTIEEFKAFVLQGNVIDLAVGVIIGGAFGKIVNSLITDIIMPPIGLLISNVNFRDLKFRIGGTEEAPVVLSYGNFIQSTFEFLMIAFCIFMVIRFMSKLRKADEKAVEPSAPTPTSEEIILLREIRDSLKK